MKKRAQQGLTLMEMLLVTVLVSVAGIAIFHTFSNGLKLWDRGIKIDHDGDMAIWLDKFGEDLRSVLPVSGIRFNGTEMRLAFPSLVLAPADHNSARASEGLADQIGAVEYRFDAGEGKVYRRQANYGQAVKGQWGAEQEVARGLVEVTFNYYFASANGFIGKSAAQDKIPGAVTVELRLHGDSGDHWFKRYYLVPVGN